MSNLEARVFNAVTRAAPRGRGKLLLLNEREAIAEEVLAELGDDLIDEDAVPDPGYARFTFGDPVEEWCPTCNRSTLTRLAAYTTLGDSVIRVGAIALCQACGWSPYTHTTPDPEGNGG